MRVLDGGDSHDMFGIEETIATGMCVGCGGCSVATGGAVKLTLSRHRVYEADLDGLTPDQLAVANRVCPFSDAAADEDELGAPHPAPGARHDPRAGSYTTVHAGRVHEDSYIMGSSSGGLTSWVLDQLLARGEVDGIIHVGRASGDDLFGYQISTTREQLRAERKSQYYSTTLNEVLLAAAAQQGMRYAIVGVPCFIKAARLVARQMPEVDAVLTYYVGLVCGHLKSQFFAESLAWQTGIAPDRLESVDFRVKNPDKPASQYDFQATDVDGRVATRATQSLAGGNWGHGAFQPEACNFCDDIFAETADIVFGDAWLPKYKDDWRGTNVVVSRNARLDAILSEGIASGELDMEPLSLDDAATSQGGNFRHRRQGLAVRLADDIAAGKQVPTKRVQPDLKAASTARRRLIRKRREMSHKSLDWFAEAREKSNLDTFLVPFRREMKEYERLSVLGRPLWPRIANKARRVLRKLKK